MPRVALPRVAEPSSRSPSMRCVMPCVMTHVRHHLLPSTALCKFSIMLRLRTRILATQRRALTPAPSAAWDPSRKAAVPPSTATTVNISLELPEDAIAEVSAKSGSTLMDALAAADLSDVYDMRGACGGACQCSTCRVVIVAAPAPLPPRGEQEEDMLDTAATAASRQPDADEDAAAAYLDENSRLACQLVLRPQDDGLIVRLPDDVLNILEVPLWLRGSR